MKRIVALIIGVALMVPGMASAQSGSTCQSYNPQLCSVASNQAAHGTTPGASSSPSSSGTLPFTGINVGLLAAGGGALLGAGFMVRRLSRDLS